LIKTQITNFHRSELQGDSLSSGLSNTAVNAENGEQLIDMSFQPPAAISVVQTNNDGVTRRYDKKQYCLFCGSKQSRLIRHLVNQHGTEKEVLEILALKNNKLEKNKSMTRLRNLGNHAHNCEVLREGQGQLLVTYRPKSAVSPSEYLPCEHCFGYLTKRQLWRHRCKLREDKKSGRVMANSAMLLPIPKGISSKVYEVISRMVDGQVKVIAKSDEIIMKYAAKLYLRLGVEQHAYIRDKIREVTRLMIEIRKKEGFSDCSLKDCMRPEMFREVVSALRALSGFDETTRQYKTPSLALHIGHALTACSKIAKGLAIETKNSELLQAIKGFSNLCKLEWTDEVSRNATKTLYKRKRNKAKLLPLAEDVTKLNKYLELQTEKASKSICVENKSLEIKRLWRTIAETTLTHLIVFNRRRQGEVSKMKLEDYLNRPTSPVSSDVQSSLSRLEQELCKIFIRIEIEGKRGRTVPVLINGEMQRALKLLVDNRTHAGVPLDNPYLFACSNYGSLSYIRGSDCLRKFAIACESSHPETLTSTNFRKHIATMSQLLSLNENEMDMLAQFMGHDIRIHREYYRLPEDTLQLAKMSKLFLMMENGVISNLSGKTLDEAAVNLGTGLNY